MIYETYSLQKSNGTVEYGFTFKHSHQCEDSEFDLALGALTGIRRGESIASRCKAYEWAAKAICAAAPNVED